MSTASSVYFQTPEFWDAQPMSARCLLCDWHFAGTAGSARESFREHRAAHHPETFRPGKARVRRILKAEIVTVCTRNGCITPPSGEGSFPSLCGPHAAGAAANRANRRALGKAW